MRVRTEIEAAINLFDAEAEQRLLIYGREDKQFTYAAHASQILRWALGERNTGMDPLLAKIKKAHA